MGRRLVAPVVLFLLISCGRQDSLSGFKKGSRLYQFATVLAGKVPVMDPDKNQTLATCRYFSVKVDSFLIELVNESGKNVFDWAGLDAAQTEKTIKNNVRRMVERKLLLRAARSVNIGITPVELDTAMQRLYRQNGSRKVFQHRLLNDGLTLEQVKQTLTKEMVLHKLFQKIETTELQVDEQEVRDLYNQDKTVTFRHILLVRHGESDSAWALRLKNLNTKIAAFMDFAKLAKQYSDDPHTRKSGGLYESIHRDYLPSALDKVVFSAPIGTVQHIATAEGDHFLLVIRRDKEARPFTQVRPELEANLIRQKKQDRIMNFKERLFQKAQIEIIPLKVR
jgi:parvulin-like peptidyl-prolyl isomerase